MRSFETALALLFLLIPLGSQPQPSPHPTRDEPTDWSIDTVHPKALPLASEDTSENPTPTEENLSLDELKKQRDQAISDAKDLNDTVQALKGELEKKRAEAVEPTRIFNEKNATFMKLDEIARGKEAEYNDKKDAADAARGEFTSAESALNIANGQFDAADKAVRDHPDNIQKARDEVQRVKNAPADRIALTGQKTDKVNGKPALELRVGQLEKAAKDANTKLVDAKKRLDEAQSRFDQDKCADPAKKDDQNCKNKLTTLNTATTKYNNADTANNTAFATLKEPKEELDNFDTDLAALNKKIADLTKIEKNLQIYIQLAQNEVNTLVGQTDALTEQLNGAKEAQRLAKEDFDKKETAKNDAESKEIAPDDSEAARSLATTAELEMEDQFAVKDPIDKQVKEIEDKLEAAQKSYNDAKSKADLAEQQYDTAMRKDAEARKGIFGAAVGAVAGSIVVVVGAALGIVACRETSVLCFKNSKPWFRRRKVRRAEKTNVGPATTSSKQNTPKQANSPSFSVSQNESPRVPITIQPGSDGGPKSPGKNDCVPLPNGTVPGCHPALKYSDVVGYTIPLKIFLILNQQERDALPDTTRCTIEGEDILVIPEFIRPNRYHGLEGLTHSLDDPQAKNTKFCHPNFDPLGTTCTLLGFGHEKFVDTGPASGRDWAKDPDGYTWDVAAYDKYQEVYAASKNKEEAKRARDAEFARILAEVKDIKEEMTKSGRSISEAQEYLNSKKEKKGICAKVCAKSDKNQRSAKENNKNKGNKDNKDDIVKEDNAKGSKSKSIKEKASKPREEKGGSKEGVKGKDNKKNEVK